MKTTIKILEEKLKSLEWDADYHTKRLKQVQDEWSNVDAELAELKLKYPAEPESESEATRV